MSIIIPSCLGVRTAKRRNLKEREREARSDAGLWDETRMGVKMTLLEITTATLNVLHYMICDKTLLWRGL